MEKAGTLGASAPPAASEASQPPLYPQMPPMDPPPPYTPHPGFAVPQPQAVPQPAAPGVTVPPRVDIHVIRARMGPHSQQVTCGRCGALIMTETHVRPGLLTYLLCSALILLSCFWGCCLIPCCIPECQDVDHRCPSCNAHLGTYKRL
ncbi:lipopolysaccharide-induced tumor necrosis factor-alpha factor homolog [Galendromus occidentalis]|uniref:Lipopolysaccharide-induced tumor necrosis factor-alpha factor homolog n=1 Tax=Galendromus occidentalis TaxID=34638 RepID=A0AAJ6QPI1_9ACAR|nr:lipopolysaccharide-induced tumor necrosis factor-alpha factor homolog [Galendromus occidentalis]